MSNTFLQEIDATIILWDVSKFSRLAADMGALELASALERFYEHVERYVQRHGGRIVKFVGDAVLSVVLGSGEVDHAGQALLFDDVRTPADMVVGAPGDGWKVAMGTLAFERGVLTLGQQMAFDRELGHIISAARESGANDDPRVRQRLARLWGEVRIMRLNAQRTLSVDAQVELVPEAMIGKLYWADLHQRMGEAAVDLAGAAAGITDGRYGEHDALDERHRLFFFSRADTIYGGSNEIQRNVIGERALGLPKG